MRTLCGIKLKYVGFSEADYDLGSVKSMETFNRPFTSERIWPRDLKELVRYINFVYLNMIIEAVVFFHPVCLPLKK